MLKEELTELNKCVNKKILGYYFNEDYQCLVLVLEGELQLMIKEASQSGALNITVNDLPQL